MCFFCTESCLPFPLSSHFLSPSLSFSFFSSGVPYMNIVRVNMIPELVKASCSMFGAWGDAIKNTDGLLLLVLLFLFLLLLLLVVVVVVVLVLVLVLVLVNVCVSVSVGAGVDVGVIVVIFLLSHNHYYYIHRYPYPTPCFGLEHGWSLPKVPRGCCLSP